MRILNLNSINILNNYPQRSAQKNEYSFEVKLNSLNNDVVSFKANNKKDKKTHKKPATQGTQKNKNPQANLQGGRHFDKLKKKIQNSSQTFNPQEAQARRLEKQKAKELEQQQLVEAKIAYEHAKAETKKKYVHPNLSLRIKEHIISDKELFFVINKIKDYPELINETFLEPENGTLLFHMSDNIMQKILGESTDYNSLLRLITTKDEDGKLFIEKLPTSKIATFNESLKRTPTALIAAYLTENKKKQIPAHYMPLEGLSLMNEALKDYPAIIAQIYTHTDNAGNTPMHNRFRKGQSIIKDALIFQPETLARIRRIKNKHGDYPETVLKKAENYSGPYEETWKIILNEF